MSQPHRRYVRPGLSNKRPLPKGVLMAFICFSGMIVAIWQLGVLWYRPQFTQREIPVIDHASAVMVPAVLPTPPQKEQTQRMPNHTVMVKPKPVVDACNDVDTDTRDHPTTSPTRRRPYIGPPSYDDEEEYRVIPFDPNDPGCPESDNLALEEVRQPQTDEIVRQREQTRRIIGPPE